MERLISGYLFVYSSLRVGFRSDDYEYIHQYFSFLGNAKVRGKLSDMGDYPVGTPTPEDYFIKGELYKINDENEFSYAIGQLDDYEGINPERGEASLYKRELTNVFREEMESVYAWIYWFSGDVEGKPVVASGDVMEYVKTKNLT
jgi:gamma-glutamylcyclotransferase (GGCT)/AIG2-like uncharacterized protein YtfP